MNVNKEYKGINELYFDMIQTVFENDCEAGDTLEVLGFTGTVMNPLFNVLELDSFKFNPFYSAALFIWILCKEEGREFIEKYMPGFDGLMFGSRLGTQLETASYKLKDPNTRQCLIALWESKDLAGNEVYKIKCSSMHFFSRSNRLYLIVNMRCEDLMCTPYSIFIFSCLQNLLAESLRLDLGTITYSVGSLYMNKEDHYWSNKIYDELKDKNTEHGLTEYARHAWSKDTRRICKKLSSLLIHTQNAVIANTNDNTELVKTNLYGDMLGDCLALAASKFGNKKQHSLSMIRSPILKRLAESQF